jgi:hypothetical protein
MLILLYFLAIPPRYPQAYPYPELTRDGARNHNAAAVLVAE